MARKIKLETRNNKRERMERARGTETKRRDKEKLRKRK